MSQRSDQRWGRPIFGTRRRVERSGTTTSSKAFEFAHCGRSRRGALYNDYGIDVGAKRDRALRLIRQIKRSGLRIDAVGFKGTGRCKLPPGGHRTGAFRLINERVTS